MKHTAFFLLAIFVFAGCIKEDIRDSSYTPPVTPVAPILNQPCFSKEYDLDITVIDTFEFIDNYYDPWGYAVSNYYDVTFIESKIVIPSLGEFNLFVQEFADPNESNDSIVSSSFSIYKGIYLSGEDNLSGIPSINFKKLILQGGGSFNGIFSLMTGSAEKCVFTNLAPLAITGSLDVATSTVMLKMKGKVYF